MLVQWTEAPGHVRRPVAASQVARVLAAMKEVSAAEQSQKAPRMQAAWLAASRELVALIDGPERALHRRVEQAAQEGRSLVVVVRALAEQHGALREHPATRMHWQLLPLTDATDHGHRRFHAVLQLGPRVPGVAQALPYRGLRLLCMAFAPQDVQPVLDHEAEEERYLEVLAPFISKGQAHVRIVEDGTLEELGRALLVDHYDILLLTGHGVMTAAGPRLVMEDDTGVRRRRDGKVVDVSPAELVDVLRRASTVPALVVLSNCHSAESRDAMPSFAVELVAAGVPAVLGWTRPVRDDHATDATGDIFQQLAAGKPLDQAVELAREELRKRDQGPRPDGTWATLALVASDAGGLRVDRQAPSLPEVVDAEAAYKFLASGQMKVLRRGFVGRRRPLQRLVRMLRDGKFADQDGGEPRDVAGVVVWGMKGVGKSCLVGRVVDRAAQHEPELGLVVLHGVLDDSAVLHAFQQLAIDWWGDVDAARLLADKETPALQRVRRVLARWRTRPVVLILDDFEQNLEVDDAGPAQLRPHAVELLDVLLPACKLGRPKLMITTTAMFAAPAAQAAALGELCLGTLETASVRKLWVRGPSAGAHIPISLVHWEALAARLGRNARTLGWARDLLAGKTSDELAEIAARAAVAVPVWQPGDEMAQEEHDRLAQMFLRHLADQEVRANVGADAREFLRRARVFEHAVPMEAFAGLTEGLAIDLDRDLVPLANLALLEVGELDGQRAYRVSPLIEPAFTAERPELWHVAASRFWWSVRETGKGGAEALERTTRAWQHALAGRHEELAERAGRVIDSTLFSSGLYGENRRQAEEHLAALPGAPFASQWAGEAEYYATGPTPRARRLNQAAYRAFIEKYGTDKHPDVAESLHAVGVVLMAQGAMQEARNAIERSLAIQSEVHGTDLHPEVAVNLHTLGTFLQAQGELQGARTAIERSLAIQAEVHGTDMHPHVAASLYSLGVVLHQQGELQGARTAIERSLAIRAEVHGTNVHPHVAASLHALGRVLHEQGELQGARTALERALAIYVEVYGTDIHPHVAMIRHALGGMLQAQGDLPGARTAFERALAIYAEVYRTDIHPHVATSRHALGGVLQAQGDLLGARTAFERSLAIYAEVHGTDKHPDVAASLHAMGGVLMAQGDLQGARTALERALAIKVEVYGTDKHLYVAASLHVLGGVLLAQGDLQGARTARERSLAIHAEVYETDQHPDVAACLYALGDVLLAQGDLQGARTALERSLAIQAELHGTDKHSVVAASLHALAMVCIAEQKPREAVALFRRALTIEAHCFRSQLASLTSPQ